MRSTHISRLSRPAVCVVLFLAALLVLGCNLFNVGLGAKVDIAEPVVAIVAPVNGQYLNGAFTVQGSVSDDLGVKSVGLVVSFPAETGLAARTIAATVDGNTWRADLDAAALAPGTEANASILVTATDVSSKTSERKIILYLDNKAPTVRLSSPTAEDLANAEQVYNGSVVFKGSSDTDVADLILETGGREFHPANGNNASFRIQVDTALLGDGDHGFRLWAVDNAGNKSVESAGTLRVAQASDLPALSFKGAEADVIDLSDTSRVKATNKNIFARGLTINGTLSDDDGLDLGSLRLVLTDAVTGDTVATWQRGDPTYNISLKALGYNTDPNYSSYVTSATLAFSIPSAFPQGIYKLAGTVSDALGAKAAPMAASGLPAPTVAVDSFSGTYFVVDDGKPTATIDTFPGTAVMKTFSATGTAEAALGVGRIEYQLDATTEGSWNSVACPGETPLFAWSIPSTVLPEKSYKLYVRPFSNGNAQGPVVSANFTIDTTLPVVAAQAAAPSTGSDALRPASFAEAAVADAPGGVLATVNGKARFRGVASDKALASVSWAIIHVASTASSPWTLDGSSLAEGSFSAATMSDWSLVVDTSAAPYVDGQHYALTIKALDEAGNEGSAAYSFLVDQATDSPGLSYLSMKTTGIDAATAKLNLLGVNDLVLTATLVDDDRIDPDSLLLSFNGGAASPVTGNQASSGALTINQSLDSLPEGRNWFTLSFSDLGAWKHGLAPVQTVVGPIWFVVDTVQPQMAYDSSATTYNLGNSHLTIGGTISTANGLDPDDTLVLKIGGSPVTLKLGAGVTVKSAGNPNVWDWSHEFDASAIGDGPLAIRATAKDEFGLPGSMDFQVTVDKTPPVISAFNPGTVFSPNNGRILYGPARDATTGVASIEAVVTDSLLAVVDPALAPVSLNLDAATPGSASGGWTLDTTALPTGSYTIALTARDKTGNTTILAPFVIKVDQEAPVATFTDMPGSLIDTTLYCSSVTVMPATWSGLASDPFLATATLKIDQAAAVAVSLAGPAWSLPLDWAGLGQGRHELVLTVTDLGGFATTARLVFVKDTLAPELVLGSISSDGSTVVLDAQTTKVTGSLTDATALASATASLDYSPDGGTGWTPIETGVSLGSPSATIWNFSKDLTGAAFAADGLWRISVTATDSLGNSASSAPVSFRLDRKDPALSLDALAATVLNKGFSASGSASSANLGGVSWWIDGGSPTALAGPFPTASAYALALALSDGDVAALSEGSHTLSFQASSLGGRQVQRSLSFAVDRTAPVVTWSNILETGTSVLQSPSPQVIGTAKDDNGVVLVERRVERWTGGAWAAVDLVPADGFVPMVSITGQIYTWTADLSDSLSFPDGKYRMTLRSTDVASPANLALSTPVVFYLDRALPTAAIDSPSSGAAYNQGFAVTGTAADANLASVVATLDGSVSLTVSGLETWSVALSAAQVLGLAEGPHSISVSSRDIVAGNSSLVQTLAFRVDRSAPTVSRSSISFAGGTVVPDSSPRITGTLTDASGLASGTVTLEQFDYATGSWSTLSGWNAASLGIAGNPTSFDWSLDLSSSATYPDGRYRLSLAATDTSLPAKVLAQGPVMFMLSRANPTAAVTGPAMGSYQNAAPVLWGRATDANGILGVEAKAGSGGEVSFLSGTTSALAAISLSLDAGTDLFTASKAHGLLNGDLVYLAYDSGGSLPGASGTVISSGTGYYVVQTGATTFKLSLLSGGAAIDFSSSGVSLIAASSRLAWGGTSLWWLVPALDLGSAPDGSLTAWVQASAGSGKLAVASRDFTLDATKPLISLSSPSSGSRSVGNLTLIGTSTDPGSSPSGMAGGIQYQVGKGANLSNPASWTSANVSGGSYSWSIYLGDMSAYANATYAIQCDPSGNASGAYNLWRLPVYFQAQDNAGNVQQKTDWWLILDPDGNIPSIGLTQPTQNGLAYGGQQRISGTASQPTWVHDVQVCVDPTNSGNYPDTPASTLDTGTGLFTSVAAHGLVAGSIVFIKGDILPRIAGTSVNPSTPYYVIPSGLSPTTFRVSETEGGSAVSFSSAGATLAVDPWQKATLMTTGTSVIWYCDINKGSIFPQSGYTSQTVGVQARAWNSPTAGGARGSLVGHLSSPLTMTFNSTFPKLEDIYVSPSASSLDPEARSYYSQISTRASFYVLATVSSTKGITRIDKVEDSPLSGSTALYDVGVSYGASSTVTPQGETTAGSFLSGSSYQLMITSLGTTDWQALGAPAGAKVGSVFTPSGPGSGSGTALQSDSTGAFKYRVAIPVDSTAIYPDTTGIYSFDIRSTDMTSTAQVSTQTITLNEDNYYPNAGISSSASMTGSQFVLQGSAIDTGAGAGSISGFSKVVVYLLRSGQVVRLSDGSLVAPSSLGVKDMTAAGAITTVAYPGAGANLRLSIDSLGENNVLPAGSGNDANGDGYLESLTITGSSYNWMAQLDSSLIADGPVEVHYVAFDTAGNATHFAQAAYISNNAPAITGVTLGTDLTGSGSINTTSAFHGGYGATGFTAVNKRLSFQVATIRGNGALSYSLTHGGTEYWGQAGTTVVGDTVTLDFTAISPGIGDIGGNGAAFVLTVTDSTPGGPQSASVSLGLNIQNFDLVAPVTTVSPLYWTDASHNSLYQNSSTYGHLDLGSLRTAKYNPWAGTAPYGLPAGLSDSDARVSGSIRFEGTVSDNQRISRLSMQIGTATSGYDFGNGVGVAYDVAAWNGTALVGVDQWAARGWRLTISDESLGNTGHHASWVLEWNSARLNTVAATDVTVLVEASDASANPSSAASARIDVVPYISSLSTRITSVLSADFARTAKGGFPILYNSATPASSEAFTISGFNLNPTSLVAGASSDLRLSRLYPSGFSNAATPLRTGIGLAGSGVNATYTQVTANVQQAGLGNGYLTVVTNGVPSINNVNDSDQAYNAESSTTVASMTDARFLDLWDITLLRTTATYARGASYVSMAMRNDTPQFAYSNNTYGFGINFFHNGTTETQIYQNWNFMTYSALALNSSGSRAALYDVNVASAGVDYYSDWGGIQVNFFFNPPASVWNTSATYYRAYNLWLDNLHIPGNLATLDRFQFPSLAMIGADADSTVFYSVYDSINDQVLFRTFHVGTTVAAGANNVKGAQASNLYTNLTQVNQGNTYPTFLDNATNNSRFSGAGGGVAANNNSGKTPGAQVITLKPGVTTGAGNFTSVAATSAGAALLVYYRTSDNQLVYCYNDTPTNSATWSPPQSLASLVGGNYVKMVVDSANRVHIAYYDSYNGGVKYILIPTYNAPATNTQVVVDNYLTAGDKLSLAVDGNGKPFISYKGVGNTAKVAWLSGSLASLADGVDAQKRLTGAWEVQVIPNKIVDSDSNRFLMGVGSTTYRPVIGYTNNDSGAKGIEYLTLCADLAQ